MRLSALPMILVVVIVGLGSAAPAVAILIPYQFTVRIQEIDVADSNSAHIGQTFDGHLLVDDSILLTDGPSNAGRPHDFHLQIGPAIWDQNDPAHGLQGSEFEGFRGPCYNSALHCTSEQHAIWGLGSEFLGFEVLNGTIVGLWGGIYGQGDAPFVDFNGTTVNVRVSNLKTGPPFGWASFQGAVSVLRVDEPSTAVLFAFGFLSSLCFLLLFRCRIRRAR